MLFVFELLCFGSFVVVVGCLVFVFFSLGLVPTPGFDGVRFRSVALCCKMFGLCLLGPVVFLVVLGLLLGC